jgi:hypothetical protein
VNATSDWERLYFDDFDLWCERQIEALNRHKDKLLADLDAERIAEELQLMQRRERLDAEAQIMRVIEHLLKLQYATEHEPAGGSGGARCTGRAAPSTCSRPRASSPSWKRCYLGCELAKCELRDIGQISLAESIPHACPYAFEQILDEEWWPVWADPPKPTG